jgi:hypothetical protein
MLQRQLTPESTLQNSYETLAQLLDLKKTVVNIDFASNRIERFNVIIYTIPYRALELQEKSRNIIFTFA